MDCIICNNTNADISLRCCKVPYHTTCINKWFTKSFTCPTCRKEQVYTKKINRCNTLLPPDDISQILNNITQSDIDLLSRSENPVTYLRYHFG